VCDPKYEDFGNFNYGVIGAASGYDLETLLRAAGAVQVAVDLKHWVGRGFRGPIQSGEGMPWSGKPYGDQPIDGHWIILGYLYYYQHYHRQ